VSPSHRGGSLGELVKETAAVAVGRIVGFDRLVDIDDQIERSRPVSTPEALPSDVRSAASGG
jgi:hypothetical protein